MFKVAPFKIKNKFQRQIPADFTSTWQWFAQLAARTGCPRRQHQLKESMLNLINQSEISMPRKWLEQSFEFIRKELKLKATQELTVVFLDPKPARKINKQYRHKDYATDVLSFESEFPQQLGELIICPQVIRKQALEHDHSFKAELAYMLIHGVLHLLGYDHEKSPREATKMFKIQDQLFDRLCTKFHI